MEFKTGDTQTVPTPRLCGIFAQLEFHAISTFLSLKNMCALHVMEKTTQYARYWSLNFELFGLDKHFVPLMLLEKEKKPDIQTSNSNIHGSNNDRD